MYKWIRRLIPLWMFAIMLCLPMTAQAATTMNIGGTKVKETAGDVTSGWKKGAGWKYYAGKYLYLYNCDLSSSEIEVNGSDLVILCEGVNKVGRLAVDKNVTVFGNGVLLVDEVNLNKDCLKLSDAMAPALFMKEAKKTYTLMNPASAAGIISGNNTLPSGNTYKIPSGTTCRVIMADDKGGSLTVPSGTTLEIKGEMIVESQAGGASHAALVDEGTVKIAAGSRVKLDGSLVLSGTLDCAEEIEADGQVLVKGSCSSSHVSIKGGTVTLAEGAELGTLTSAGDTTLCLTGPYRATVGKLERPQGGSLTICGYTYQKNNEADKRENGLSTLTVTDSMTGSDAASYVIDDGIVEMKKAPGSKVKVESGYVVQNTEAEEGTFEMAEGSVRVVKGTAAAAAAESVPVTLVKIENAVSEDGYSHTTQEQYAPVAETTVDLSSHVSSGAYSLKAGDFAALIEENHGAVAASKVVATGTNAAGELITTELSGDSASQWASLIDIRIHVGEAAAEAPADPKGAITIGGSTQGGTDDGTAKVLGEVDAVSAGTVYTYRITATAGEGGSISPNGVTNIESGKSQTYTISPADGYETESVKVNGNAVKIQKSYTFSKVSANGTIAVTFKKKPVTYQITATAGTGGTISPSGKQTVNPGDSKTYTITAKSGYAISSVKVDGKGVGAVSTYTFKNISKDHTIAVTFSARETSTQKQTTAHLESFTIRAYAGEGGSISPAGESEFAQNSNGLYTIKAAEGYRIKDVLVDGYSVGAVDSYRFEKITGDHKITAEFVSTSEQESTSAEEETELVTGESETETLETVETETITSPETEEETQAGTTEVTANTKNLALMLIAAGILLAGIAAIIVLMIMREK